MHAETIFTTLQTEKDDQRLHAEEIVDTQKKHANRICEKREKPIVECEECGTYGSGGEFH